MRRRRKARIDSPSSLLYSKSTRIFAKNHLDSTDINSSLKIAISWNLLSKTSVTQSPPIQIFYAGFVCFGFALPKMPNLA